MKKYYLLLSCLVFSLSAMDTPHKKVKQNITVKIIFNHFDRAIRENQFDNAQKWYERFSLLIAADWKSFNSEMIEKYAQQDSDFIDALNNIKPKKETKINVDFLEKFKEIEREMALKEEQAQWLISELNNGTIDVDWKEFLGEHKERSTDERIAYLSDIGKLKIQ